MSFADELYRNVKLIGDLVSVEVGKEQFPSYEVNFKLLCYYKSQWFFILILTFINDPLKPYHFLSFPFFFLFAPSFSLLVSKYVNLWEYFIVMTTDGELMKEMIIVISRGYGDRL